MVVSLGLGSSGSRLGGKVGRQLQPHDQEKFRKCIDSTVISTFTITSPSFITKRWVNYKPRHTP